MSNNSPTNIDGNAILHNAQGDVVAIVTDIHKNESTDNPQQSQQHLLSTNSNQNASILPPLIADDVATKSNETDIKKDIVPTLQIENNEENADSQNIENNNETIPENNTEPKAAESRWTKENRILLKQLMGGLPPHDIGAALRVILDTFGVESSKLVRRGEFIELDLREISDDYILDSLWNYCYQMQYNIMNTLQQQQQQQQQFHYQPQQQYHTIPAQHAVPIQVIQQQQQPIYQQVQYAQQPMYQQMQPLPPQINDTQYTQQDINNL